MHSHTRYATATWLGGLKKGSGELALESGALKSSFDFKSRLSKNNSALNPEELLGSALAGSYIMFFTRTLESNNKSVLELDVKVLVHLSSGLSGPSIDKISMIIQGRVSDITQEEFNKLANETTKYCPISKLVLVNNFIEIETHLQN